MMCFTWKRTFANRFRNFSYRRDHLIVDYGSVVFDKSNTTLWLPWSAEMFMELRGKRYHHRHTLTDYMLFSVDATTTITKPKEALQEEQH